MSSSSVLFITISLLLSLLLCQNHCGSAEDERGPSSRLPDAEGDVCRSKGRGERRQRGRFNRIANKHQHPFGACGAPRLVPVTDTQSRGCETKCLLLNPQDMGEKAHGGRELRPIDSRFCVSEILSVLPLSKYTSGCL